MTARISACWALLICVAATGCGDTIYFDVISAPPPGKVASINHKSITISRGIAMAIECIRESDLDVLRPCGPAKPRSEQPTNVLAFATESSSTFSARRPGRYTSQQEERHLAQEPRSLFVIAGINPGVAHLVVETDAIVATFDVTVVDD